MRDLHIAHVEIVVGKNGAADRTDENGVVLHSHFLQSFGNQLVRDAVSATRAVVRLLLEVGFAFVEVVEDGGLGVNCGVGFSFGSSASATLSSIAIVPSGEASSCP